LIQAGDDLLAIMLNAIDAAGITLQARDVLVISSKIVSKAEGRLIDLKTIEPDEHAREVATATGKDPRIVALVLNESASISRQSRGVLVTQHRLGFISANAGIDQSNVSADGDIALLLPENPDVTAETLRDGIKRVTAADVGVIISDSHGRPFRMGNIGVAIGAAGLPTLLDLRGQKDLFGRELKISLQGYGDLIASAAHLVCGEGDEGLPLVLVRGLTYTITDGKGADLTRPPEQDLYR
jgi:coenzyme F420-0:L-glutamate ligase/coenzyme F420-1:gamma-L-glutamate ligase